MILKIPFTENNELCRDFDLIQNVFESRCSCQKQLGEVILTSIGLIKVVLWLLEKSLKNLKYFKFYYI